jgi:hypothetical protein
MKKQKLIPVKVYFSDAELVKRLEHVTKVTGFSVSGVSAMAVRFGIAQVEEALLEVNQISSPVGDGKKGRARKQAPN